MVLSGGGHYFIAVKAASEKSAFGAPLNEIDLVDDNGLHIPAVLVVMKRYLYDQQGLNQEGSLWSCTVRSAHAVCRHFSTARQ
jgi:hypothetical protein